MATLWIGWLSPEAARGARSRSKADRSSGSPPLVWCQAPRGATVRNLRSVETPDSISRGAVGLSRVWVSDLATQSRFCSVRTKRESSSDHVPRNGSICGAFATHRRRRRPSGRVSPPPHPRQQSLRRPRAPPRGNKKYLSSTCVSKLHYVSRTWSNVVIYHDRTLTLLAFVVLGQCQPVPGPRQPTARVPTWHVARRGGRRRWVGVVCASPHRYPCSTHGLSRPQRGPGPPGGNTRPAAGRCSSCAKGPSW